MLVSTILEETRPIAIGKICDNKHLDTVTAITENLV